MSLNRIQIFGRLRFYRTSTRDSGGDGDGDCTRGSVFVGGAGVVARGVRGPGVARGPSGVRRAVARAARGAWAAVVGVTVFGFAPAGDGGFGLGTAGLAAQDLVTSVPLPEWVPVLLVPGWADDATILTPLRDRFVRAGWPETHVASLTFSNATGSNEVHAEEIAKAAALLMALTGAPQVDIVAHSMGGLASREWMRRAGEARSFGGDPVPVRRVVFLGTPHRGTVVASFSWGDGGREMVPGSFFLTRLNAAAPVPEGVRALAIRTPVDTRVIPASSAELRGEGVENLELCCPTHPGLVDDDRTFAALLAFLQDDRRTAQPPGGLDPSTRSGYSWGLSRWADGGFGPRP